MQLIGYNNIDFLLPNIKIASYEINAGNNERQKIACSASPFRKTPLGLCAKCKKIKVVSKMALTKYAYNVTITKKPCVCCTELRFNFKIIILFYQKILCFCIVTIDKQEKL